MNVLVTGGTGSVGGAAVALLVEEGHRVTVVGRREKLDVPGATYQSVDINDYDALHEAMKGNDVVVHLAAIASPFAVPGREVFRVDALGTFNVFESAANLGIRRVVGASSINAFGYFFGDRGFPIEYLPVDEAHEGIATDAYSFSKQVMERIGSYFWERDGISSVMLRLPGVYGHAALEEFAKTRPDGLPPLVRRLLALSHEACAAEVARISDAYDRYRRANRWDEMDKSSNPWEKPEHVQGFLTEEEFDLMSWRANLFTFIDELDSAQAIAKGVAAEYGGSHPLYVNSNRNTLGLPVAEVARLFGDPAPAIRPQRPGDDTIVSIDRARDIIGFEPRYAMPGAPSDDQ